MSEGSNLETHFSRQRVLRRSPGSLRNGSMASTLVVPYLLDYQHKRLSVYKLGMAWFVAIGVRIPTWLKNHLLVGGVSAVIHPTDPSSLAAPTFQRLEHLGRVSGLCCSRYSYFSVHFSTGSFGEGGFFIPFLLLIVVVFVLLYLVSEPGPCRG